MQYTIDWLIKKWERDEPLKFIFFWGHTGNNNTVVEKNCFSQWFESPFTVNDITYKTAEHWMMAHKALLFNDSENFEKIIHCNKAAEAKKLGREIMAYNEEIWNTHKYDIVKQGNIHKFSQHPKLAEFLLNTDPRIIVEASPVDTIWGIGLSQDDENIQNIYAWRGENLLGFALMEVRDILRNNL